MSTLLLLLVVAAVLCACVNGNGGKVPRTADTTTNDEIKGTLYSLQEAYDRGFLTKADVMLIVYFLDDSAFEVVPVTVDGEVWVMDDFVPQIETPALTMLDQKTINNMKMAFYLKHRQGLEDAIQYEKNNGSIDKNTSEIDTISVDSFLGKYNDFFAIQMSSSLFEYGTGNFFENVASVEWSQFTPQIIIYTALSLEENDE